MLDLKWIRDNPAALDEGLARRGAAPQSTALLRLDQARRHAQTALQEMQERRNTTSKEIGTRKAKGEEAADLMAEIGDLKTRMAAAEENVHQLDAELEALLAGIPNLPAADVPDGRDENDNVELRRHGTPPDFTFPVQEHVALGQGLGQMDFARAATLSGARFVVLSDGLARLERALAAFMLTLHTTEFGYREISPPYLVHGPALFGTGQLPKFADDLFHTTDDRWLIPTAEVPLTNLVAGEILSEDDLPLRFVAHTPCFRSEAGAAGRDTHGMIRQHQFSKVELVSITHPDASDEELERLTAAAEEVLKRLGLPYRMVVLCSGDMGFAACKTYDIEVWLPAQKRYREISSCSNCGDFQARRMAARFRPKEGKGTRFVHTLNGSGLAVGRTLIAILENYQEADGSIAIPEALQPFMGGEKKLTPDV